MILHRFVNQPQKTPFSPVYDYFIYEAIITEVDFDWLLDFCLKKEKELKSSFPPSVDGQTGLGKTSITSRFPYYNFFQFNEVTVFKKIVKFHHDKILDTLGIPTTKIFGQSWINVLRNTEQIKRHRHGIDNYSYMSGNICIYSNNTQTCYTNPYTGKEFGSDNIIGKITMFPGWLEHYTEPVLNDIERVTIGFDLVNEIGFIEDIFDNKKFRWPEIT